MKRKLFSFSASVITAIMLTACAAAPENKPASSAALSPTSEAVATAIPSTSNANWKLPPQYDFDEMIPLFSRETHTAGYAAARNLYAVRKGERWSLFNAANCNAFLEDLSESIPYLYGEQELSIGVDDTYDYQKLNALEEQIRTHKFSHATIVIPFGNQKRFIALLKFLFLDFLISKGLYHPDS